MNIQYLETVAMKIPHISDTFYLGSKSALLLGVLVAGKSD